MNYIKPFDAISRKLAQFRSSIWLLMQIFFSSSSLFFFFNGLLCLLIWNFIYKLFVFFNSHSNLAWLAIRNWMLEAKACLTLNKNMWNWKSNKKLFSILLHWESHNRLVGVLCEIMKLNLISFRRKQRSTVHCSSNTKFINLLNVFATGFLCYLAFESIKSIPFRRAHKLKAKIWSIFFFLFALLIISQSQYSFPLLNNAFSLWRVCYALGVCVCVCVRSVNLGIWLKSKFY